MSVTESDIAAIVAATMAAMANGGTVAAPAAPATVAPATPAVDMAALERRHATYSDRVAGFGNGGTPRPFAAWLAWEESRGKVPAGTTMAATGTAAPAATVAPATAKVATATATRGEVKGWCGHSKTHGDDRCSIHAPASYWPTIHAALIAAGVPVVVKS